MTKREYNIAYYRKNKDALLERNRLYRLDHKEAYAQRDKKYQSKNKVKIREKHKEYYLKNKEKIISQTTESRRKRLGRIVGQRKNPWNNPEYRAMMLEKRKNQKSPRYWLGKRFSDEAKRKMSESRKGKSSWNKGKKHTEERKKQISQFFTGKQYSKGKTHTVSIETRRLLSEMKKGDKAPNWKGGLTAEQKRIRSSIDYKLWREAVFKRDNYTCVSCGDKFIKGVTGRVILNADHIKSFSEFPELRFDVDNGRTLCYDCHRKTPTWGGVTKFRKAQCLA